MKRIPTFESFLSEAINVNPNKYIATHGKAPEGKGFWCFSIGGESINTPSAMHYVDAIKWATQISKERGLHFFDVLP